MTNTTQTPAPIPAPAARVTIDDVRTAIGSTDPNQTNASKVRALLGNRGSFETIQKHLATIRQELAIAAAPPVSTDAIPALPAEAVQAIWVAAWSAAQVVTLRRTETLAAERDAALLKLETMGQDVAGLVATVDEQTGQLDQAAVAQQAVRLEEQAATTKWAELAVELDRTKSEAIAALDHARQELTMAQADAAHAAQIAEAGRDLMRQELARLTDQVGELKAALYKRVEAPSVVTLTQPPSPAGQ